MTLAEVPVLIVAGTVAGVFSTVVGLASVVSYPALLAIGLPPLSANMTNTVALLFTGLGAAAGSRPELTGQAARIRRLGLITALGGGAGAALLLITSSQTFVRVAPVLIGTASLVLLLPLRRGGEPGREAGPGAPGGHGGAPGGHGGAPGGHGGGPGSREDGPRARPGSRSAVLRGPRSERNPWLLAGVFGVAVYVGYFGAAGGIVMLALLTAMVAQPLARTNAVKNILGAVANTVAAVAFAVLGHVDWAAVVPLAAGFILGGWTGPALVRRLPARVLRILVAVCGLAVAVKLGLSAYA